MIIGTTPGMTITVIARALIIMGMVTITLSGIQAGIIHNTQLCII